MSLTVTSFFQYYMFHSNLAPKHQDRVISAITSVALGILTLGLIHIFCYAALYNKKFAPITEKTAEDNKATQVFDEKIKNEEKEGSEIEGSFTEEDTDSIPPLDEKEKDPKAEDLLPDTKTVTVVPPSTEGTEKGDGEITYIDLSKKKSAEEGKEKKSKDTPYPRRNSVLFRRKSDKDLKSPATEKGSIKRNRSESKLKRFFSLKNVHKHGQHEDKDKIHRDEDDKQPAKETKEKRTKTRRWNSVKHVKHDDEIKPGTKKFAKKTSKATKEKRKKTRRWNSLKNLKEKITHKKKEEIAESKE